MNFLRLRTLMAAGFKDLAAVCLLPGFSPSDLFGILFGDFATRPQASLMPIYVKFTDGERSVGREYERGPYRSVRQQQQTLFARNFETGAVETIATMDSEGKWNIPGLSFRYADWVLIE